MSPLPVINDVFRCSIHWVHSSGQRAVNVFHVQSSTLTAQAVANLIDASVTANMWQPVSSSASVQELHVLPLDGSSSTLEKVTTGTKWAGSTTGDMTPQAACLLSLKTGLRGPANRGRMYLPFIAESSAGNGTLVVASQTTLNAAWLAFIAALGAGGAELVVASYKNANAHQLDSIAAEIPLATQRRRQDRLRF